MRVNKHLVSWARLEWNSSWCGPGCAAAAENRIRYRCPLVSPHSYPHRRYLRLHCRRSCSRLPYSGRVCRGWWRKPPGISCRRRANMRYGRGLPSPHAPPSTCSAPTTQPRSHIYSNAPKLLLIWNKWNVHIDYHIGNTLYSLYIHFTSSLFGIFDFTWCVYS